MRKDFAKVLIELPDGKVREFRSDEGRLQVVTTNVTLDNGKGGEKKESVRFVQFVAKIEEDEL